MTKNVRITLSFPIPEKTDPNADYNELDEDLYEYWSKAKNAQPGSPYDRSLRDWIEGLLTEEETGIAEYNTVKVEKVEWF